MESIPGLCATCKDISLSALLKSIPIPRYPKGGGCGVPSYFEFSIPQPLLFPTIEATKNSCALCFLLSQSQLNSNAPAAPADQPLKLAAMCPPSRNTGYYLQNEPYTDPFARTGPREPQWWGFSEGDVRVNTLEPITQQSGTRSKTDSHYITSPWQINVAADEDSPASKYITRRPLSKQGSTGSFRNLVRVLEDCNANHVSCKLGVDGRRLEEPTELPSRVIDVGDAETLPRIHQPYGQRASYATLSHCWGEQRWVALTVESLPQMLESFDMATIPKTYADAIIVTRELGIRYLWIDSFCILQDDQNDWENESQKMGDIYEKAFVNIAATGAASGASGLLDTRKQPSYILVPGDTPGNHFYFTTQPNSSFEDQVNRVKLNTRGWVMQERLLSRRTIHFATDMWYWECGECITSEDGWQHQPPSDSNKPTSSLRQTLGGSVTAIGKIFRPDESLETATQARTEVLWAQILRAYSNCNLTFSRDKLPALQGLVNRFKGVTPLPYLFGHWIQNHEALPPSTMWSAATNGGLDFPEFKLAPSWSCLKGNGPMEFYDTRGTTPCTQIDGVEGDFPALVLRGRIRNGIVAFPNGEPAEKPTHYSLSFKSKTQYGTFTNTLGPGQFDDATDIPQEVTLLLTYEKLPRPKYLNDQKDQLALVLRELSQPDAGPHKAQEEAIEPKLFQRIGIAHVNNRSFFNDVPFSRFTIL